MKFKYRVKGKVKCQMVLRGMLFRVGSEIDFCVSESELTFIKANCEVREIVNLEPKRVVEPTQSPILETHNEENEIKSKEVVNDGSKRRNPKGQRPHKEEV